MTARSPLLLALLAGAITGCTGNRKPDPPVVPQVVEVAVTRYVPIPAELTADCHASAPQEQTYAEAKRLALVRAEALEECTARMRKIRALGTP